MMDFPAVRWLRPISGILNNIPQQRLLWVSIYIQNVVCEAWEMCGLVRSRYLRWGGASRDAGEALWRPRPSVHATAGDVFAPEDRVREKLGAAFECGRCQTHKSPWGCVWIWCRSRFAASWPITALDLSGSSSSSQSVFLHPETKLLFEPAAALIIACFKCSSSPLFSIQTNTSGMSLSDSTPLRLFSLFWTYFK